MTIVESTRPITGGVDTHLDVPVAAALDGNGGVLGVESFATTPAGYRDLRDWLVGFGDLERVGVEGTGAYGAGLARFLQRTGVEVIEVDRPNRQERRRHGKSDELDAVEAARAALGGRCRAVAKTGDGAMEAMRALLVAKRSGRQARIRSLNQIRHLSFTAPDDLRARLQHVPTRKVAVVLDVPMEECPSCGDRWLRWEIAARLDEMLSEMLAMDIEVATRHFDSNLTAA